MIITIVIYVDMKFKEGSLVNNCIMYYFYIILDKKVKYINIKVTRM